MSYFILGSNSFSGATYVNQLLLRGECVIGISRSSQPHPVLCPYHSNPNYKNFYFYQLDLNRHAQKIFDVINKHKPKYIIDFASQSMVAESWLSPEAWYTTNIVAKVRLHQYLRQCDFLERYIRISTPEVYGHTPEKITETARFNPSTPYAVSQAAMDMSVLAFYRQYQFPVVITRFANFYGPYQALYRIIPRAIIYGFLNKELPLHGGGASIRAFIYSTDFTRGVDAVIQRGKLGETYHFSDDHFISITDLIRKITSLLQIPYESLVTVVSDRPGKDNQYLMDATKAQRELDWKPRVLLEEGLYETIHWVKKGIDSIKALPFEYIHKD
ncbi:MAG: hypothetical protein A3I12_00830 [Gammaproteobacteria bacterium RIFCSPLOWO2_02_FULL_38_11]|nr:MAG: hypothetical protein A3B69_03225 [Gammaproteobacteria bacterium RIFCSPHIGHO2_02_FULL_38_33]OGT23233.1 MAG: hypothetical protein A2W47_06005 [Gammaproteobacteria bacterium RIFCSPHIGHO2_12_38_15]OGT66935.1 MAG: hypothetical protein A3I12_00830 [Gammaproteobacteria bacterium RIFCSPLOWO2_02_FULL_38_11]